MRTGVDNRRGSAYHRTSAADGQRHGTEGGTTMATAEQILAVVERNDDAGYVAHLAPTPVNPTDPIQSGQPWYAHATCAYCWQHIGQAFYCADEDDAREFAKGVAERHAPACVQASLRDQYRARLKPKPDWVGSTPAWRPSEEAKSAEVSAMGVARRAAYTAAARVRQGENEGALRTLMGAVAEFEREWGNADDADAIDNGEIAPSHLEFLMSEMIRKAGFAGVV